MNGVPASGRGGSTSRRLLLLSIEFNHAVFSGNGVLAQSQARALRQQCLLYLALPNTAPTTLLPLQGQNARLKPTV